MGSEFEFTETDLPKAKREVDRFIGLLLRETKCQDYLCFLSGKKNYRKDLLASYKGNRSEMVRPKLLGDLKDYIVDKHKGMFESNIEADDLLGLYSRKIPNSMIATIDKDLRMIYNTEVYNWDTKKTECLTQTEALRFHMWQTLVGDKTDNYKGCPYVGPKKADKLLNEAEEMEQEINFPFNGVASLNTCYWMCVLEAYEKKGLSEEDALVQARCAYILREPEDYSFDTQRVNLWVPS